MCVCSRGCCVCRSENVSVCVQSRAQMRAAENSRTAQSKKGKRHNAAAADSSPLPASSASCSCSAALTASASASARRYSRGKTLTNARRSRSQLSSTRRATSEPVKRRWRDTRRLTKATSLASSSGSRSPATSALARDGRRPSGSCTNARPPLMPAPKLRPVGPRMTATPPVMYSQAWSPTPSTTACAPKRAAVVVVVVV